VSDWDQIFLGVIAVSTLAMAVVQLALIVYALMLARRAAQYLSRFEQDVSGIIANLDSMARDAAKASALAATQAERFDETFRDLSTRIRHTAATLEGNILRPVRTGIAVLAGVRAAVAVIKNLLTQSDEEKQG